MSRRSVAGFVESSAGQGPRATAKYDRDDPWQVTFLGIYEKRLSTFRKRR